MFANSIIAQSQNQKIGSSTVANPNAAVTSGSDCGCGGSTYQGLIASSQKVGDCGCGGHEEDNPPQGLAKRMTGRIGGMFTLSTDCITYPRRRYITDSPLEPGGYIWEFDEECETTYSWTQTGIEWSPDSFHIPPVEELTPNCPNCLTMKKHYHEIKNQINNPGSAMSKEAKVLYDFLVNSCKTMLQSIIDKYSDTVNSLYPNDQNKDTIISRISKAFNQGLSSTFIKNNLLRFLEFIISGITDEDVNNENVSKCKGMILPRLNWSTGDLEFQEYNNLDFNPFGGYDYLEENPTFYPRHNHQKYLFSDVAIALEKKAEGDTRCKGDKYKVFEYNDGNWIKK